MSTGEISHPHAIHPQKIYFNIISQYPLPECFNLISLTSSKCHTWSFLLAFCLCLSSILPGYLITSRHQWKHSCFFKIYLLYKTSPVFLNLIFFRCLNSHRTKILFWNIQSSTPIKIQCIIFKSLPSSGTAERWGLSSKPEDHTFILTRLRV